MNTLKLKFPSGVNIDTETRDKLADNGWKIEYFEPTTPTPKWLPIDRYNLPQTLVASINRNEDNPQVYTGSLHPNDANNMLYIQSIGGYVRLSNFTHYIPLTDLLNLPISE